MIQQPYCTVFLFINSGSGSGIGQKLVSQEIEKLEFQIQIQQKHPPKIIYAYFFDLKTKRDKAFKLVKQATQLDQKVIGIVCGGDGTIMWVVSQLFKYQINAIKIALGVIPLGTGNDFSQYLGWGKEKTSIIQNNYKHLKKLIKKWIVAKQQQFDIWDVRAEIFENGRFQKVNKNGQNETIRTKEGPRATTINYSFCNYFSFGIDAKIGYSFDKHRTQSRVGNFMVYGTMGLIKAATKTKTLQELIQKMEIRQIDHQELPNNKPLGEDSLIKERDQSAQNSIRLKENNLQASVIFKTKSSINNLLESNNNNNKTILLENDYQNFLVLNINSFMGGVTDIWSKAKINQNTTGAFYSQTSSKDGKLQIMCFSSGMGLALERLIGGFATKITQGQGPYYLNFKRYENEPKYRTYLQIDGQFIRFTHPKTIYISKSKLGNQGKIRVLRRNLQGQRSLNI